MFVINMSYETTKAADADLLAAHHAIAEAASGVARDLHLLPVVTGNKNRRMCCTYPPYTHIFFDLIGSCRAQ